MDTDNLVAHARARFEHAAARRTLKEKYQSKLTFAYRGGMFKAGPELHSAIFTCGRQGKAVMLDLYETPVKIDTVELMQISQERWNEQMNAWLVEYEQLNQNR